jgi:hypothetical protein
MCTPAIFIPLKCVNTIFFKIAGEHLPLSSRLRENTLQYRIFDAGGHMIQSEHMKSCLTAQKHFLLFKGPGSFKFFYKICGNVHELKAYRLIPLTPPPFSFYTTFKSRHFDRKFKQYIILVENWLL